MNPNKQRIAIAEACGWKFETGEKYIGGMSIVATNPTGKSANGYVGKAYRTNDSISGWDAKDGVYFKIEDIFKHPNHVVGPVPDYLNDLNAISEAEKTLYKGMINQEYWQKGYGRFTTTLAEICVTPYSATAAQRAEAFLRTIGKWEE